MVSIGQRYLKTLMNSFKLHYVSKHFRKMKRVGMPLQSLMVEKPFVQWGLDVIGPINPKSSKGNSCIVTSTDSFTKWKEAAALINS
jgi:hypothetical protein